MSEMRDEGSPDSVRRAHEELEELLLQDFGHQLSHRPRERRGEESRRSKRQTFNFDDRSASINSTQRHIEPTLLGSGWSWQMPKDDGGPGAVPIDDTAEDPSLRAFGAAKDHSWHNSPDEWQGIRKGGQRCSTSPSGLSPPPALQHQLGDSFSDFSESESESGDGWSSSSSENTFDENLDFRSLDCVIGRGAFGSVYKIQWKGQPAAVKIIEHEDELGGLQDLDSDISSNDGLAEEAADSFGGGSLGRLGSHRLSSKLSTVKLTPSEGISINTSHADQAMLEAAMCSAMHHPNVVQTYHYSTTPAGLDGRAMRETRIVMELCDAGSLEHASSDGRLSVPGGRDIDLEVLCLTLLEVANAMEYLHKMHVTHRDLKLANVLLKTAPVTETDRRGFTAKVSDFGLSRLLPDISPKPGAKGEHTGTITHMAPELLEHGGMSRAADIYSFGILMWEALMGESAYEGISKMQVMFGVVSEGLRPAFPPNTPAWFSRTATACWRQDPKQR